ncbi:MAG: diacylglycerol kinase family lipid kinase [Bacteroidetes bacterium]|nr:diacylglycerol kinase family lipid kinase [Bacteroidota bacterium]
MLEKTPPWLVVINPHAGGSKAKSDWPKIRALLEEASFQYDAVFSEYPHHAIPLVKQLIEEKGYTRVLAVGGDGTLNEVVNGIFQQQRFDPKKITLGLITIGTGNDWGRMYAMPKSYKKQIKILKKRHVLLQDVGKVKYLHDTEEISRYFVNIAGMGFDALVAKKTNLLKEKGSGGPLSYLYSLVTGLFEFHPIHLDIESDGASLFSGNIFSVSIGICKYNGGGMKQLPNAIPNDGLFDVTIIKKMSKAKVLRSIHKVYDGTFIQMEEVKTFTGKEFTLTSSPTHKAFLETDGESLGHSPLHFTVVPSAIGLVVRKKMKVLYAGKGN